jgi:hypothetical protein
MGRGGGLEVTNLVGAGWTDCGLQQQLRCSLKRHAGHQVFLQLPKGVGWVTEARDQVRSELPSELTSVCVPGMCIARHTTPGCRCAWGTSGHTWVPLCMGNKLLQHSSALSQVY